MSPAMRARLTRNIGYHASMQQHYLDEDKKEKEANPPQQGRGQPKPVQSAAERLAEMHGDVVKQLEAVLEADPPYSGIEEAQLRQRPLRNTGARLKPDAGYFAKPVIH